MKDEELVDALQGFLVRRTGRPARVAALRQLAGGASCRVYSFDLAGCGDPRTLVLRLDAVGGTAGNAGGTVRREEFELLAAAARGGVTVPAVHWYGDESEGLGGAFFVMDLVAGEAIARRLLRDQRYERTRSALPRDLGRELARIHAVDLDDPRLGFIAGRAAGGDDRRRFALAEVGKYRQLLEGFSGEQPYPLLMLVGRWLEQHAPALARPALVHGDFRVGNVMFDEEGLTAVLDWELCHVGDPIEDLGWLCVRTWRFGSDDKPAGGLCSREELCSHYGAEGGSEVAPAALRFWELFGNWKWAIICRVQAARAGAGRYPDVELATIGRRVAETEWEMLELLEG
ncbi:MAG: phosphotransferase family protein [Deltaproteobacteria bacterium]|nr:phosphotransferase family protein [Deltaproteobacteria bacterium]